MFGCYNEIYSTFTCIHNSFSSAASSFTTKFLVLLFNTTKSFNWSFNATPWISQKTMMWNLKRARMLSPLCLYLTWLSHYPLRIDLLFDLPPLRINLEFDGNENQDISDRQMIGNRRFIWVNRGTIFAINSICWSEFEFEVKLRGNNVHVS